MAANNIISVFLRSANEHAHKLAFAEDKTSISYLQLEKSVRRYAADLQKQGIQQGDPVLVFMPPSIELYKTLLSLFYMGAVPVFIDQWVSPRRLNACLETVPCRAIIAPRKLLWLGWLLKGFRKIPVKLAPLTGTEPQLAIPPAEVDPEDTALITFTTGSTGKPKAADRTHQFLASQLNALTELVEGNYDRSLTLLPIVVLLNLAAGKTVILPSRPAKQKASYYSYLSKLIDTQQVEAVIASPTILFELSKNIKKKLAHIVTGGGPLFPFQAKQILQSFQPDFAKAVYGSTEAEPVSTIGLEQLSSTPDQVILNKGLPVGIIHPGIEIAIISFENQHLHQLSLEEWQSIQAANGKAGEIVVKGEHVLVTNYIKNSAAWEAVKLVVGRDIWHRTGDAGRIGEDGQLYFLGRSSERFVSANKQIFPLLLSYLLIQRGGISDAAVLDFNGLTFVVLKKDNAGNISRVLDDLGYTNSKLFYVQRIPKDPRHHTKTDYEKLRKMLK